MDALLSAAGKKDIGHYFPDTDEKWRGANSMEMLAEVVRILQADGLVPASVSVAIQAEKPRLAKYISAMQQSLCTALSLPCDKIGISAGTNEKLGYVGEGKGITVYAYVLLCNAESKK
jgi:2-C-methyl-D-erythritol 2,4-cyclodiphosphate synthase